VASLFIICAKSQKNNFLRECFVFAVKPLTLKNFPGLLCIIDGAEHKGCETQVINIGQRTLGVKGKGIVLKILKV